MKSEFHKERGDRRRHVFSGGCNAGEALEARTAWSGDAKEENKVQ